MLFRKVFDVFMIRIDIREKSSVLFIRTFNLPTIKVVRVEGTKTFEAAMPRIGLVSKAAFPLSRWGTFTDSKTKSLFVWTEN